MKRFLSIIAAIAAAAAVAAAISLPAGADDGPGDELATFTSCLRAHGLAIPDGLEPTALKSWLRDHQDSAGFQAAIDACEPKRDKGDKAPNPSPEELVACLRHQGLTPPSTIDQLKPWMAQQDGTTAGRAALSACGVDTRPVDKARGTGGCAGDKAAGAAKVERSRTKAPTS
jgi:hypothetical protein